MNGAPEYSGRNHAILAENYMNVGLRLGYHYSVIDSYLSGNVNQNYAYFRFAGGFADRRAAAAAGPSSSGLSWINCASR